jgi:hypothetical protein
MTRLPYILPDGVTLRITHHSGPNIVSADARVSNAFVCEENAAVLEICL